MELTNTQIKAIEELTGMKLKYKINGKYVFDDKQPYDKDILTIWLKSDIPRIEMKTRDYYDYDSPKYIPIEWFIPLGKILKGDTNE